jgi:hypothetical protein
MRRTAALWLVLFAAYAATIGLQAFEKSDYAGYEPRALLAAKSLVDDHDVDVANQDSSPKRQRQVHDGAVNEAHGPGFPVLIAPAYALGGAHGVELLIAATAALAMVFAYRLALRVVPDPWALGGALAVGLSPPLLAYGTAVYPDPVAGAVLAGAALLALRLDSRPSRREAVACFALLGLLPWLGIEFVPAGLAVGWVGARALWRARRRTLALVAAEVAGFSGALYLAMNDALYGGLTPFADRDTGASFPLGYADRAYRLVALFVDRNYGLLRWAPVLALAFLGGWLLWRSRRGRVARAVPGVRDIELAAGLCAAALGAQVLVAAFVAPTMFGFWFPARHLVAALPLAVPLAAWGLRHAPRAGTALALLSVAASAWLYLDVRLGDGGLAAARPDAPFGPLTRAFPLFERGATWPFVAAAATGCALAVLAVYELRGRTLAPEPGD